DLLGGCLGCARHTVALYEKFLGIAIGAEAVARMDGKSSHSHPAQNYPFLKCGFCRDSGLEFCFATDLAALPLLTCSYIYILSTSWRLGFHAFWYCGLYGF